MFEVSTSKGGQVISVNGRMPGLVIKNLQGSGPEGSLIFDFKNVLYLECHVVGFDYVQVSIP